MGGGMGWGGSPVREANSGDKFGNMPGAPNKLGSPALGRSAALIVFEP
jgi:hypothetical protein